MHPSAHPVTKVPLVFVLRPIERAGCRPGSRGRKPRTAAFGCRHTMSHAVTRVPALQRTLAQPGQLNARPQPQNKICVPPFLHRGITRSLQHLVHTLSQPITYVDRSSIVLLIDIIHDLSTLINPNVLSAECENPLEFTVCAIVSQTGGFPST